MNINKLFDGQIEKKKIQKMIDDRAFTFVANDSKTSVVYEIHCKEIIRKYAEHFLVKFLDSEIERLEHTKAIVSNIAYLTNPPQYPWNNNEEAVGGYNRAIADQITYLRDIKRQLTESK